MNAKLLATLGLSFLPLSAFAQEGSVILYGTLNADAERVKAEGAATGNLSARSRVSSNSSNIGFKGTEELGGGLKAWFQIESAVSVDGGGSTFASRNTGVGLSSTAWGSLMVGQWDTPYKQATAPLDPFGNTSIAAYSGLYHLNASQFNSGIATSRTNSNTSAPLAQPYTFDLRASNTVAYVSPKFAGFEAKLSYATGEAVNANGGKPQLWSVAGAYENGPLYAAVAYERHNDTSTALGVDGKAQNWNLGVGYSFGDTKLAAGYERQKSEDETAAGASFKRPAWFVAASQKFGNTILRVRYNKANEQELNGTDVPGTEAKQWTVGVGQALSKRTELFALYTRIRNDAAASYDFGINAISPTAVLAPGADPRGFAVGIKHTF